jgi:hypothetical protein
MVPVPKEPVSQVVFVEDYLQLVFHEERFSFYDVVEVVSDQRVLARGQPNFCDALVNLIGERAASVAVDDAGELTVMFDSGFAVRARSGLSGVSPEAWQFNGPDGKIIVSLC